MVNITKCILCIGFFLFAFQVNATETNEVQGIREGHYSESQAIHFGPRPN